MHPDWSLFEDALKFAGPLLKDLRSLRGFFINPEAKSEPVRNSSTDHSALLQEVLAATEADNDPLTGVWDLSNWPTPPNSQTMKGRYVDRGQLAVFYKNRRDNYWRGLMTHVTKKAEGEPEGPRSEPPFTAIYEVRFELENNVITGTSKMNEKWYENSTPALEAAWEKQKQKIYRGDFSNCRTEKQKFAGQFQNKKSPDIVPFEFTERRRWSQVTKLPGL